MSQRLCSICGALIDPNGEGIEIIQNNGRGSGRMTVRDNRAKLVHILESDAKTQKYLAAQQPKAETVTTIPRAEAPSPPSLEEETFLALVAAAAKDEGQRIAREKAAQHPAPAPEVFIPEPAWEPGDEIYEARVREICGAYFFATLTNGEDVYCWKDRCTALPNEHFCSALLAVGDTIGVKITRSTRSTGSVPRKAKEIHLQSNRPVPMPPKSGTIIGWSHGQSGVVARDCGCRLL